MQTSIIVFVAAWAYLALVPAIVAGARGRNAAGWFVLALAIGPLLALTAVLVTPGTAEAAGGKACPDCAETVKRAALKCRFCGHAFEPEPEAPPAAAEPADPLAGREVIEVYKGRTIFRHANGCPAIVYKDGTVQDYIRLDIARRAIDGDEAAIIL